MTDQDFIKDIETGIDFLTTFFAKGSDPAITCGTSSQETTNTGTARKSKEEESRGVTALGATATYDTPRDPKCPQASKAYWPTCDYVS